MQKILLQLFMGINILNFMAGCSSKNYPSGTYQEKAVTADGELSEWMEPLRFGSTGGQVQYNITNDHENLYIALKTTDAPTAIKILTAGIDVYIDAAGGKSKSTCLAFPLPAAGSSNRRANNGNAKPGTNDYREGLLVQAVSFTATGFKNMDNRTYDVSDKKNIAVAIQSQPDNSLAYEAVIPLQNIFGAANYNNRNINVGVTINPMKGEAQRAPGNGGSARGMHSGGGRGGGRSGGGANYQRGEGNNRQASEIASTPGRDGLYKADVNWYAFKLANK